MKTLGRVGWLGFWGELSEWSRHRYILCRRLFFVWGGACAVVSVPVSGGGISQRRGSGRGAASRAGHARLGAHIRHSGYRTRSLSLPRRFAHQLVSRTTMPSLTSAERDALRRAVSVHGRAWDAIVVSGACPGRGVRTLRWGWDAICEEGVVEAAGPAAEPRCACRPFARRAAREDRALHTLRTALGLHCAERW